LVEAAVKILVQTQHDCSQTEAVYQVQDDEKAGQHSRSSLFGWLKKDDKVSDIDV